MIGREFDNATLGVRAKIVAQSAAAFTLEVTAIQGWPSWALAVGDTFELRLPADIEARKAAVEDIQADWSAV